MLHFSCDLCGNPLDDQRFVVKLETYPAFDPTELTEDDLTEDNLQQVAKAIQEIELGGHDPLPDCSAKSYRFDLCPRCHARFVKDPLGRELVRRLNFSQN